MKTVVLSLGGSLIHPGKIDIEYLKKFKKLIMKQKQKKFIIITGGGVVCREYIDAAKKISHCKNRDHDWIGVRSTALNAELVRSMFSKVTTDTIKPDYTAPKVKFGKVLVGCGFIPGHSSDYDAVRYAIKYGAKEVLNLSNIAYAYDKDPKKYKNAKKLEKVSWKEFRKVVGSKWKAGGNFPFDPLASIAADKAGLKVVIMKGNDLKNIDNYLNGRSFKGTVIE